MWKFATDVRGYGNIVIKDIKKKLVFIQDILVRTELSDQIFPFMLLSVHILKASQSFMLWDMCTKCLTKTFTSQRESVNLLQVCVGGSTERWYELNLGSCVPLRWMERSKGPFTLASYNNWTIEWTAKKWNVLYSEDTFTCQLLHGLKSLIMACLQIFAVVWTEKFTQ